jgi:hypothetical protein
MRNYENIQRVVELNGKYEDGEIVFTNGYKLTTYHESDCCESHYWSLNDLSIDDFDGLEFDLDNDNFFERVEGYGIKLIPINGHPISIPGYGSNNGYYSENLALVLSYNGETIKEFDITRCQVISD